MRKKLMLKHIPFSCNKMMQPFILMGGLITWGSSLELRLNSSSFHSADRG